MAQAGIEQDFGVAPVRRHQVTAVIKQSIVFILVPDHTVGSAHGWEVDVWGHHHSQHRHAGQRWKLVQRLKVNVGPQVVSEVVVTDLYGFGVEWVGYPEDCGGLAEYSAHAVLHQAGLGFDRFDGGSGHVPIDGTLLCHDSVVKGWNGRADGGLVVPARRQARLSRPSDAIPIKLCQ